MKRDGAQSSRPFNNWGRKVTLSEGLPVPEDDRAYVLFIGNNQEAFGFSRSSLRGLRPGHWQQLPTFIQFYAKDVTAGFLMDGRRSSPRAYHSETGWMESSRPLSK